MRSRNVPLSVLCSGLAVAFCADRGSAAPTDTCHLLSLHPESLEMNAAISALAADDLDHDGGADVIVASASGGFVRVLFHRGASDFVAVTFPLGIEPSALGVGDPDADGDRDVLVGGASGFLTLENDGAGGLAAGGFTPFPPGDSGASGATFVDVDGDGDLDALLTVSHHPLGASWTGGLIAALGDGLGAFTLLPTHALPLPAARGVFADFDGDARVDVAELGGYGSNSAIAFARNLGSGSFVNSTTMLAAGSYASGFAAADIDADGDVDVASGGKYTTYVYGNDGFAAFSLVQSYFAGNYVKGLAFGDVDGDGDADLLATSGSTSSLSLAWNDGSGHFAPGPAAPASVQTTSVVLADVDEDGFLDPFAGDVTTGRLSFAFTHCSVATYGQAKPNSAGCLPALVPSGAPAISGPGFQVVAAKLLPGQPALVVVGAAAQSLPALGGVLWVAPPFTIFPAITSGSSGATGCIGSLTLAASGATLAPAGVGSRLYLQVLSADPYVGDGTGASLTAGLVFEILP